MNHLRRYAVILAFAFWMGGFTFYAAVVIPTAHDVLGSHREVGFITQRVTRWLNGAGVVALTIFAWNLCALWRGFPWKLRRTLALTLALMIATQVALFIEHHILDGLIDAETQSIVLHGRFYGWHRVYLLTAALQWLASALHVWWLFIGIHPTCKAERLR